ncbi:succinate dehydrogenase [Pedobacter sp. HMF7647]|uniref:Succinate dehydrogenase n=1 Tax=Hufsiella arboris TaxID=2695275 RepID=A0A7K1YAJ4_9SPHI|nr:succinate dehydrogenase cytochrome b subunit [Hufsiella arboris]MXV51606.1 succinate dehydrogenase [Hufsiella arboris]
MGNFKSTFSSTLGKKLIMALTGLFLCTFLIVHLVGNLQIFSHDGGKAFNEYSYFMTHFPPIKIISYLLYASIIIHAVYALILTLHNQKARPVKYAVYEGGKNASWSSRNMGILGTVLLIFIVTHMANFWFKYHNDMVPFVEYRTSLQTGETTVKEIPASEFRDFVKYVDNGVEIVRAKDLYQQVSYAFQNVWLVILYVVAMAAMGFHLYHGFWSAFQTFGWDHKKYMPIVSFLGVWVFAVLIPLGFAAMPLYVYFTK